MSTTSLTGVDPYDEGDLGTWLGDWQPDVERVRAEFDADRKPRARL